MNKYTVKALSAIYRNILKKCFLINAGIFLLSAPAIASNLIVSTGDNITNPKSEKPAFSDDGKEGYYYDKINVTGGSLSINNLDVKTESDSSDAINISGGTVTLNNEGELKAHSGTMNISGGIFNAQNDSEIFAKDLIISNGEINVKNSVMGGEHGVAISGGTITLNNSYFLNALNYPISENNYFNMTGGVVNLNNAMLGTNLSEDDSDVGAVGKAEISGGTINVVSGNKNVLLMKNPTFSGVLNVAQNTSIGIYNNYMETGDTDITYYNKGTIYLTNNGTITNNGTLVANINVSGGKLNNNSYINTEIFSMSGGEVNINGGKINAVNNGEGGVFVSDGASLTVDNAEISGDAVRIIGGEVTVKDSEFEAIDGGFEVTGGRLSVTSINNRVSLTSDGISISGGEVTLNGDIDFTNDDVENKSFEIIGDAKVTLSGAETVIGTNHGDGYDSKQGRFVMADESSLSVTGKGTNYIEGGDISINGNAKVDISTGATLQTLATLTDDYQPNEKSTIKLGSELDDEAMINNNGTLIANIVGNGKVVNNGVINGNISGVNLTLGKTGSLAKTAVLDELNNLTIKDKSGNLSKIVTSKTTDLNNLSLENGKYTLSNSVFKGSEGNQKEYALREIIDDEGKWLYYTYNPAGYEDYYEDYYTNIVKSIIPYANQIENNLELNNAELTVNTDLIVGDINLDNSKLTTKKMLTVTGTEYPNGKITLSNNSQMNVSGTGKEELSLDSISINDSILNLNKLDEITILSNIALDNSTLNLTAIEDMFISEGDINAESNSKIIINKWAELYGGGDAILNLQDSSLMANSELYVSGITLNANHSKLDIKNSDVFFDSYNNSNDSIIENSSEVILSKNTYFSSSNMNVSDSDITVNDGSKFGSIIFAGKDEDYAYVMYPVENSSNVNIDGSTITLNGKSSLENSIAEFKETLTGRDKYIGTVTSNSWVDGYEYYVDSLEDIHGNINVSFSDVIMNGTSTIANNLFNTSSDSGNVILNGVSLDINGNNKIVATGDIVVDNYGAVSINKGATLTAVSNNGTSNVITINGTLSELKLAGTLNASISGEVDTLVLGKSYKLGKDAELNITGMNGFGISGITSNKDINTVLGDFDLSSIDLFSIYDKSKVAYDDNFSNLGIKFDNIDIENKSIFDIKNELEAKSIWADDSTINVKGNLTVNEIFTSDSNVNITGTKTSSVVLTALENELGYISVVKWDGKDKVALNINYATVKSNEMNVYGMPTATISNAILNTDLTIIPNVYDTQIENNLVALPNKVTLSNVEVTGTTNIDAAKTVLIKDSTLKELSIATDDDYESWNEDKLSFLSYDKKGNLIYNVATIQNTEIDNLSVDNTKVVLNKGTVINNAIFGEGLANIEVKDNITLSNDVSLKESATFVLSNAKSQVNGNVTLEDTATIAFNNAKAILNGDITGGNVEFNKVKGDMSAFVTGDLSANNIILNSSTLTIDNVSGANFGLNKSTLTLKSDLTADNVVADASKIYLGTNTLSAATVNLSNKSSIFLDIDKEDNYGKISATDIITLGQTKGKADTALTVTIAKGYNPKNDTYTFLDGDVYGDLGTVKIVNNRVTFKETKVGTFEVTDYKTGKGVLDRTHRSINAKRAAVALVDNDVEFASVKTNALSNKLNVLSQIGDLDDYATALNAANPDDNNMITENTMTTTNVAMNAVTDRLSSGGVNSFDGVSSGDVVNGDAAIWAKFLYNKSKLDSFGNYEGFEANTNGLALGFEKNTISDVKVGLGYAYSDSRIKNDIRNTDADTHTFMLYGEYKPSQWFVDGILSYGWSDYTSKAHSILGITKSDFDVYATSVKMSTGYDLALNNDTTVTPIVGVQYTNINRESYTDSDDKHISGNNSDIVTLSAATKIKSRYDISDNISITPELRLGISYDVMNGHDISTVSLSNGTSYMVECRALNRFATELGVGVTTTVNDNLDLTLSYEGKYRENYRDNTGMLNIKYNF